MAEFARAFAGRLVRFQPRDTIHPDIKMTPLIEKASGMRTSRNQTHP
jgi:hypothetical protein